MGLKGRQGMVGICVWSSLTQTAIVSQRLLYRTDARKHSSRRNKKNEDSKVSSHHPQRKPKTSRTPETTRIRSKQSIALNDARNQNQRKMNQALPLSRAKRPSQSPMVHVGTFASPTTLPFLMLFPNTRPTGSMNPAASATSNTVLDSTPNLHIPTRQPLIPRLERPLQPRSRRDLVGVKILRVLILAMEAVRNAHVIVAGSHTPKIEVHHRTGARRRIALRVRTVAHEANFFAVAAFPAEARGGSAVRDGRVDVPAAGEGTGGWEGCGVV